MKKFSLTALARTQVRQALVAPAGRSASTVFGGHEHTMRQAVIGIKAGVALQEHENPGEATVMVLSGRITLTSNGDSWEARTGDLLLMPAGRSQLSAIEDCAVLLSVAKLGRPGVSEVEADLV
ncbi:LuxR family transcriptional regulator [Arthrobacter sp. MYb213]|nr:cupin domain-containing protein [Arthrobacter sp. MYb213]PRB72937.1 LuxR family transcriptional regulator [Arthrobacter sp. MYb213]